MKLWVVEAISTYGSRHGVLVYSEKKGAVSRIEQHVLPNWWGTAYHYAFTTDPYDGTMSLLVSDGKIRGNETWHAMIHPLVIEGEHEYVWIMSSMTLVGNRTIIRAYSTEQEVFEAFDLLVNIDESLAETERDYIRESENCLHLMRNGASPVWNEDPEAGEETAVASLLCVADTPDETLFECARCGSNTLSFVLGDAEMDVFVRQNGSLLYGPRCPYLGQALSRDDRFYRCSKCNMAVGEGGYIARDEDHLKTLLKTQKYDRMTPRLPMNMTWEPFNEQ